MGPNHSTLTGWRDRRRSQQSNNRSSSSSRRTTPPESLSAAIAHSRVGAGSALLRVPKLLTTRTEDAAGAERGEFSNMPLLYTLARSWAWGAVSYRSMTHPDEAGAVDGKGDNALHWVVFGSPPVAPVQAILEANPKLAAAENYKGNLPLHVACSYRASTAVIQQLVKAYPEGAGKPNQEGSYPLHLVCDYGCNVDTLRAILSTAAGAASVTQKDGTFGRRPIELLCGRTNRADLHRYVSQLRERRRVERRLKKEGMKYSPRTIFSTDVSFSFWQKAALLVWVEHTRKALEDEDTTRELADSSRLLRACVANPTCPSSIQEIAILLRYDLLSQPDDGDGDLPLHIAARNSNGCAIREILNVYPEAAQRKNREGVFPLAILLEQAKSWNSLVAILIKVYPEALLSEGLDDRLYPIIWSRISSSPSALYRSIRSNSHVLKLKR